MVQWSMQKRFFKKSPKTRKQVSLTLRYRHLSVDGREFQVLLKSNKVVGASYFISCFSYNTFNDLWEPGSREEEVDSGSATLSWGTTCLSRLLSTKIVFFPEALKIPPPTRLGLAVSRETLASEKLLSLELNCVCVGKLCVEDTTDSEDGGDFSGREDTASRISTGLFASEAAGDAREGGLESKTPVGLVSSVDDVCTTFPEASMILMGTRLRTVADAGSDDDWSDDAGTFDFWTCLDKAADL